MNKNILKLFRDLMKLGKVETEQGVLIYEGDVLSEGTEVFVEDEGGNIVPAPDGQYGEYKVADGKIAPAEEPETPEEETPATEENVEQNEEVVEETPEEEVVDLTPRVEALEQMVADCQQTISELTATINELKAAKDELEFSQLKPAEKEIKDIATNDKGAMKYFK